ncbi:MAG: lysophospholipid acyltransferase family protein [Acidobacteriota bacterium]
MAREIKHWIYYFLLLPLLAVLPSRLCELLIKKIIIRFNLKYDNLSKKQASLDNIRLVFPDDPELDRKVEQNLVYDILLDASTCKFLFSGSVKRKKIIRIEDRKHLEHALEKGKGVILLTGHVGSFVSSIWGLGIHGITVSLLANDAPSSPDFSLAYRIFARITLNTVEKYCRRPVVAFPLGGDKTLASSATRQVKSLLAANEPVIVALDVPPYLTSSREKVRFLDRDCFMPSGLIRMAENSGSSIVTFYAAWDRPFSHECTIRFQEPFALTSDTSENMQNCAEAIEKIIRKHPEQWFHWDAFRHFLVDNHDE